MEDSFNVNGSNLEELLADTEDDGSRQITEQEISFQEKVKVLQARIEFMQSHPYERIDELEADIKHY